MSLTVTTGGNPSFSTVRKRVGTKSLLLNSSNPDYLLIDSQHNALFSSLNDFTVEFWYFDDTYTINFPISSSSGFEIEFNKIQTNRISVRINGTDVYRQNHGFTDWNPNVWQHFAFVRSNNTVAVYINGNIQTTLTSSTYSQSANLSDLVIGAKDYGQSGFFGGWGGNLDELRISNFARYTSNFTPTTSEFSVDSSTLLLMHMEDLSALTFNPTENILSYYTRMSVYPPPQNVGGAFNSDLFWTADGDKANFPTLQGTLTCPNGLKFGDGSFMNTASTGSSLTVQEETGSEISTEVSTIKVSNGTLIVDPNDNSIVTISTSGGGGGGSFTITDNDVTAGNVTTLNIEALGTVVNAGSNTASLFSGGSKVSSTQTYTTAALTSHQFLIDPFNTTNVTTSGITSSGTVVSYSGTYVHDASVKIDNLGIRHFAFDGTGDHIDFATSPSSGTVDQIASQGTLSMWVWSIIGTDNTADQLLSTRSPNTPGGISIFKSSNTYQIGFAHSTNSLDTVNTSVHASNGWQMVALTLAYNSNNSNYDLLLYVNGELKFTGTQSEYAPGNSGVRIGYSRTDDVVGNTTATFDGKIGHCGITNSALSAANILSIYNELKPYYVTKGLFTGDLTGNVNGGNVTSDGNIVLDMSSSTSGSVRIYGSSAQRGSLFLYTGNSSASPNTYVGFKAPAASGSSTYTMILPSTQGASNQVMKNDGNGFLSWSSHDLDDVLTAGSSSSTSGTVSLNNATMQIDILKANEIRPLVNSLVFKDSGANNITAIEDNTNIYFGKNALNAVANANTNNTAYGYSALRYAFNGTDNVAVGFQSLEDVDNANYNTAIGTSAGKSHNGSNNTFVGYNAGNSGGGTIYTYSNSTAIGANSVITKSNEIVLGTSSEEVSIPGGIALTETLPTATLSGTDLTLGTQGLTYETFNFSYGAGSTAVTISEITLGSTNRVNAQYVISVENGSSNDITFPTTINCQIGTGTAFAFKKNFSSNVVIPANGFGILTIFYKSSTVVFLSASAFS